MQWGRSAKAMIYSREMFSKMGRSINKYLRHIGPRPIAIFNFPAKYYTNMHSEFYEI